MSLTVVYDACVLYPAALRDLLIRLALEGLCHARWSEEILDEVFRNLRAKRTDLDPARLARTRRMMCAAIPDCLVAGHPNLIDSLELPDPGDRHVLAAAIHSGANVIVTDNVKDFPEEALSPYGIETCSADEFVVRLIEAAPEQVTAIIGQQAADLRNPPVSVAQLLGNLAANGLKRSTDQLRQLGLSRDSGLMQ